MMMVIASKGAIRDFYNLPRCAANCLQHVRSSGQSAIVCESRATHHALITCNMSCATWFEGTAQLLSLNHLYFSLVYCLKPLTDEGGVKPEYPEKTPVDELQREGASPPPFLFQLSHSKHFPFPSVPQYIPSLRYTSLLLGR